MKTVKQLLVLVSFGLLASTANANLILTEDVANDGNSNPSTEIEKFCVEASICELIYDYKWNFGEGADPSAPGLGTYTVAGYSGDPATSDVTWDFGTTGFGLFGIAVKTSTGWNLYGLDDTMRNSGGANVLSPFGKGSISHISFFAKAFPGDPGDPPVSIPEPGTLALLGLGLLGLGLRRRNKA